ncbi:MAG: FHA domain-containing protein [Anaerolineae bacterium]
MKTVRWLTAISILALLAVSALPAAAQGTVNLSLDDLEVAEFPQVEAIVTVADANGVPIVGLGADRFEIVEDGRSSFPPTQVETRVNGDAVISIVMVIDISGSMEGKPIKEAIRAANALLDQLSSQDRAAIIAFADEVQDLDPAVLEDGKELGFTTDKNAIRNVVNFLDTKIGWDTPLYDAIYKGVRMVEGEPVGKRAVVVMTDGRDERDNAQGVPVKDAGSLSTPDDPINEANRYNIPIFSIGLGNKLDTKYLARLAERTGGLFQQAPQPEELTPLFENVVNQLKTQYALGYRSRLPKDDSFHSLMVRVALPQGQDFDEIKFQAEPGSEQPASSSEEPVAQAQETAPVAMPASAEDSAPLAQDTPEPESEGIQGIVDSIRDTIEDEPLLAVVIGAGVLLLLILLIALIVVLLRGRGAEEEEYPSIEFDEPYSPPPPAWSPGPTDPGTPMMTPAEDRTEIAPGGWEPSGDAPPFAPAGAGEAQAPGAGAPEIPAAGGTRIIERGPKHLAMLVNKKQSDQKHDLKGTINVGRARDNQLVLDDPTVSRHHAWIKAEGEEFLVFDIGSGNGTFVNDERIEAPRRLENGDTVRFGDAEFVFTKVF